jgi:hypothetical protein
MASQQSFESHAHLPTHTIVAFALLVIAGIQFALSWPRGSGVGMIVGAAALFGCLFTLISITRVYTTRLQDRIIRVEMRLRALQLMTPAQQQALATLSLKQLAALRFASDAELPALTERAAREQLAPADIKRSIKNWVADFDRT